MSSVCLFLHAAYWVTRKCVVLVHTLLLYVLSGHIIDLLASAMKHDKLILVALFCETFVSFKEVKAGHRNRSVLYCFIQFCMINFIFLGIAAFDFFPIVFVGLRGTYVHYKLFNIYSPPSEHEFIWYLFLDYFIPKCNWFFCFCLLNENFFFWF